MLKLSDLIKRLNTFREADASFGQQRTGKIYAGGTRRILENEFGNLPNVFNIEKNRHRGVLEMLKNSK